MKKIFLVFILFFISIFSIPAYAQTIEINAPNDLAISTGGIFFFSTASNQKFKDVFPTNSLLNLGFTNFSGGPLTVAPAADFVVIGPSQDVRGNGNIILDYSMATQNVSNYGFSIIPTNGFSVFVVTPTLNASSSGGIISSSSGGGIVISSSSSGSAVSTSSSSGSIGSINKPNLTLSGPSLLTLKPQGNNVLKLTAKAESFSSNSKCQVYTSNDSLLRVKPTVFLLGQDHTTQAIRIGVPQIFAVHLIDTSTSKAVTINVTCENGASDEMDLVIKP